MIGQRVREFQLALMLLTRLPAGQLGDPAPSFAQAAWAFPIIGGLVGVLAGGICTAAYAVGFPPVIVALIAIATTAILTGAMHEDGLADLADGFGGGASIPDKLRIMRDSQIGSYGIIALILMIGLKASAITEVPSASILFAFIALGAASRAAILLPMAALPPAREDGLGENASLSIGTRFWAGAGFGAGMLALLGVAGISVGLAMVVSAGLATALARRQIGGQTGDVLGATQAISETAGWLALVLVI